jgi:hypothetical protein
MLPPQVKEYVKTNIVPGTVAFACCTAPARPATRSPHAPPPAVMDPLHPVRNTAANVRHACSPPARRAPPLAPPRRLP